MIPRIATVARANQKLNFMWHIYLNVHGLFEIAFIKNGRYIVGSRQGYVKRKTALRMIVETANMDLWEMEEKYLRIQDDTRHQSRMLNLYINAATFDINQRPQSKRYHGAKKFLKPKY